MRQSRRPGAHLDAARQGGRGQIVVGSNSREGVSPDSVGIPKIDEMSIPPRIAEVLSLRGDKSLPGQNILDM
jgi:hypothetical protein